MKAKNTEEDVIIPSKETTAIVLVSDDNLKKQFPQIGNKIEQFTKISLEIDISDNDKLVAAENNSSEIHEMIKNIEKIRKIFKSPYDTAAKKIDAYAKGLSDPLEKAKKRFNDAVAVYKTAQAALLRAAQEKKESEIKKVEEEKRDELERITRINRQLNARIYGGYWITKEGETKTAQGCLIESDCDDLQTFIMTKSPKPDSFKYFATQYEETRAQILKRLGEQKVNLHNLNSESSILRKDALTKINEAKVLADVKSLEVSEKMEKKIATETKKEITGITREIAEAHKGVRQILKFTVINPVVVPKEFFVIDETKITEYMNQNNEQIRQDLRDNKETFPGIKFFVDNAYASK